MELSASKLWDKVLKLLEGKIPENTYKTFFKNIEVEDFSDGKLKLNCTSQMAKENIMNFQKEIEGILDILLEDKIEIEINVKKYYTEINEKYRISEKKGKEYGKTGLNEKNRFNSFVVGENSKLAFNACLAVAENDVPVYNPLLIYGGSGLGKTHLMQAVGNAILEKDRTKKILYLTSEEFSNEYFELLKEGRIQEFRDTFRNLDVLLLDDIQFFEKVFGQGKGSVEEEFFHTFNKLQESGKQILMISDKYPKDIKNLSARIESRFLSGLFVGIQQPNVETRREILKNIVKTKNIEIDNNIIEYIATTVHSNVRELEGIITTINARAKLLHERITLEQVQDELENRTRTQKSKITAEKIIEIISTEYNVTISDMKSKSRKKEILNPRQMAMFLLKNILDLSLTAIGGMFGGKDHSTVIGSIRKIEEKMNEDSTFKNEVDRIKQLVIEK